MYINTSADFHVNSPSKAFLPLIWECLEARSGRGQHGGRRRTDLSGSRPGQGDVDIAILPLLYELTTSYRQGTAQGPTACIEASAQVELFDVQLNEDLPAGLSIHTIPAWDGNEPTLLQQLDSVSYTHLTLPTIVGV